MHFCLSSIQLTGQDNIKAKKVSRSCSSNITSLERSVLVQQFSDDVQRSENTIARLDQVSTSHQEKMHVSDASWVDHAKENLRSRGLSPEAVEHIMNSIRPSTKKQYSSYINRFITYLKTKDTNIMCTNNLDIVLINFLQLLFDNGASYSLINTASAAVKFYIEMLGLSLPSVDLLTRFKKGVFNMRPSLPKYSSTWDPQIVLHFR